MKIPPEALNAPLVDSANAVDMIGPRDRNVGRARQFYYERQTIVATVATFHHWLEVDLGSPVRSEPLKQADIARDAVLKLARNHNVLGQPAMGRGRSR